MSLAEGVLQVLQDAAAANGFSQVRVVRLEIGRLSQVEPEALRFCFDAVTRDTLAAGARLEILPIDGEGWCLDCRRAVPVKAFYDPCPHCGGYKVQVTGGTQMRVKELEVD